MGECAVSQKSRNVYELYFIAGGYRTYYLGTYSSLAKAKQGRDIPQKNGNLFWLPRKNGAIMNLSRNDCYLIERYKRYEIEYE